MWPVGACKEPQLIYLFSNSLSFLPVWGPCFLCNWSLHLSLIDLVISIALFVVRGELGPGFESSNQAQNILSTALLPWKQA